MKSLVLDASAAVARARGEPEGDAVAAVLGQHAGALLAPEFFWLEVINALGRRHRYTGAEMLEAVRELEELGIQTVESDALARVIVIDLVERHGLSAYDAAYLGLAEAADAQLLTLDRHLAAAAGKRAILIGPEGQISDVAEPYEAEATWPRWRGAAAYLAELRRRAASAG